MAKDKKSFVLYVDLIGRIEHLTLEEKGVLFQHLLEYVNDLNPILKDRVLIGVWKPIEQQLKRDLKKFEQVKTKRSEAGKRSAQLRALKKQQQTSTNSTSVKSVQQTSTNSTVNVNDNVNDNVNEIIDKSITINNNNFLNESLNSQQWIESLCPQFKIDIDTFKKFINEFSEHLILMEEQKDTLKQFKQHFVHWLKKQDLSLYTSKVTTKSNQLSNAKRVSMKDIMNGN